MRRLSSGPWLSRGGGRRWLACGLGGWLTILAVLGSDPASAEHAALPSPPSGADEAHGADEAQRADEVQGADELRSARVHFREGLSLEAAGNWAAALAKFERVAEVRLTPQVRFHVARCKEHLGRMTEALGDYRISEYEARQQHLDVLPEIEQAREQLQRRIPRLTIVRGARAARAQIELDGVQLGEASMGQVMQIDPGPHRLVARARGGKDFEVEFTAIENDVRRVEVVIEPEPAEPPPGVDDPPRGGAAPVDSGGEAWPWVLGGLGLASAGAGVFFLLERGDAIEQQAAHCLGSVCNEQARSTVNAAARDEALYGTLALSAFSASAVCLGLASYWWLSSEGDEAAASDGQGSIAAHSLKATALDGVITERSWLLRLGGQF